MKLPPPVRTFLPLPEATLGSNLLSIPESWYRTSATRLWEKQLALMTKTPGFPDGVGFCTFLDCDPGRPFHRRELHPVRLGMGEWRFYQSPNRMLTYWAVAQLTWARSVRSCSNP